MTRDPLLPVRLVDGVWTTKEPQTAEAKHRQEHLIAELMSPETVELGRSLNRDIHPPPDDAPHSTGARPFPCFPDPSVFADVVLPVHVDTDALQALAEYNPNTGETAVSFDAEVTCPGEEPIPVRVTAKQTPPRRIFALVALDGSGVWAIGDSAEEARAGALDHRDYFRDCARSVYDDFPPPETDAAWLDTLALVTLSGTTESLRAIVKALDDAIPWCPQDLRDNPEPAKES